MLDDEPTLPEHFEPHHGGPMPVDALARVETLWSDGALDTGYACDFRWDWWPQDYRMNLIGYRVLAPVQAHAA